MNNNDFDVTTVNDAVRNKKQKAEKVPLLFDTFEAAETLAKGLISKHHHEIASARIKYLCRNKASKKNGKLVAGNVYKMAGKFEFLAQCDFVMEIALEVWNDLNVRQRQALIDHLLAKCQGEEDETSGKMKWKVISPPVQEFPEIVERNGLWNHDVIDMRNVIIGNNEAESSITPVLRESETDSGDGFDLEDSLNA